MVIDKRQQLTINEQQLIKYKIAKIIATETECQISESMNDLAHYIKDTLLQELLFDETYRRIRK